MKKNIFWFFAATWYRVMVTVKHTFGTGKRRNCTRSGKRTKVYVYQRYGIRMNPASLSQPDGMVSSNTGISFNIFKNFYFFYKLSEKNTDPTSYTKVESILIERKIIYLSNL